MYCVRNCSFSSISELTYPYEVVYSKAGSVKTRGLRTESPEQISTAFSRKFFMNLFLKYVQYFHKTEKMLILKQIVSLQLKWPFPGSFSPVHSADVISIFPVASWLKTSTYHCASGSRTTRQSWPARHRRGWGTWACGLARAA